MAKLINIETKDEREVKDGDSIIKPAEELGVIFACQDGMCTSCLMEVVEGMDNLNEKTQNEIDNGLKDGQRLACQCKIKKGFVKVKISI